MIATTHREKMGQVISAARHQQDVLAVIYYTAHRDAVCVSWEQFRLTAQGITWTGAAFDTLSDEQLENLNTGEFNNLCDMLWTCVEIIARNKFHGRSIANIKTSMPEWFARLSRTARVFPQRFNKIA